MKKLVLLCIASLFLFALSAQERPNVLFIAIDDINDWVEPLGGHPQAQTPHLDKFCNDGAVIFKNAVTAGPICGPSRSALLTGFYPSTTGVYGNATNLIYTDLFKENTTLPEYFSKNGYYTLSNGKIFHKHASGEGYVDFGHWAYDEHARSRKGVKDGAIKEKVTSAKAGVINGVQQEDFKDKSKLSWGPTKHQFEETVDYLVADWAKQNLTERSYDKPFFMAVGIIKPHLPWFVPQEFFDLYELEDIEVPEVLDNDLDDIKNPDGSLLYKASAEYLWIKKHQLEKEATRAYLANISYADACLGHIFEALDNSPYADNTIVVIWGDHGWHLGEKQRYLKNTLWNEAAKTPFIVRMPGIEKAEYCERTVGLIDIYPTLNVLCGFPQKEILDGNDFSPLLENPQAEWLYPGITVSTGGTSVMGERYHYITNLKGAEELYDLEKDPMEWNNLIGEKKYRKIADEMRQWVPEKRAVGPKEHYKKPPNYVDAPSDPRIKPTRNLEKLN